MEHEQNAFGNSQTQRNHDMNYQMTSAVSRECLEISRQIMNNSPNAIAAAIKSINAGYNKNLNGYNEEIEAFGNCFESKEFIEGTQAFLEKRRPNF